MSTRLTGPPHYPVTMRLANDNQSTLCRKETLLHQPAVLRSGDDSPHKWSVIGNLRRFWASSGELERRSLRGGAPTARVHSYAYYSYATHAAATTLAVSTPLMSLCLEKHANEIWGLARRRSVFWTYWRTSWCCRTPNLVGPITQHGHMGSI